MIVIDCQQGSPEWHAARRGKITMSRASDICTPKTGKMGAAAYTYAYELLAQEIVPPHYWIGPADFQSKAMEHGTNTEREARDFIAFDRGVEIEQVGLVVTDCGRFACSPDGLIGDDCGLELKCPEHRTHVKYLLAGELPDEYRAQVHGSMIVTKRPRWLFASYAIGLPPLIIEVTPDDYTAKLAEALEEFWKLLESMRAKLLAMKPSEAARELEESYF